MGTHYTLGSAENYTVGGLRLFFNEDIAGVKQGFIFLGNVVTGGLTPDVQTLDHFTARTGKRSKDRSIVQQVGASLKFTLDEPNVDGMNLFMLGGAKTAVTAAPTQVVTDEKIILTGTDWVYLAHKGILTIVVTDNSVTPVSAVLNTDYEIGTFLGYTRIRRVSTSTILVSGAAALVDYTYAKPASVNFSPLTRTERKGAAVIQGVSDSGNEFEWAVDYCQLKPDGDFSFNDQDWSQFSFVMDILDNSGANSTSPFGVVSHLGTGSDL